MERSIINLYLSKVKDGDASFYDKLCTQLADRLLYIPVLDDRSVRTEADDSKTSVRVLSSVLDGKSMIAVFTSGQRYRNWESMHGTNGHFIQMLGGEFCLTLGDQTWLIVDDGARNSLQIEPKWVRHIAGIALADQVGESLGKKAAFVYNKQVRDREPFVVYSEVRIAKPNGEANGNHAVGYKNGRLNGQNGSAVVNGTSFNSNKVPAQSQLTRPERKNF